MVERQLPWERTQESADEYVHHQALPEANFASKVLEKINATFELAFGPSPVHPHLEAVIRVPKLNSRESISFSIDFNTLDKVSSELGGKAEATAAAILYGLLQLKTEVGFSPNLTLREVSINDAVISAKLGEPGLEEFEFTVPVRGFSPDKLRLSLAGPLIQELVDRRIQRDRERTQQVAETSRATAEAQQNRMTVKTIKLSPQASTLFSSIRAALENAYPNHPHLRGAETAILQLVHVDGQLGVTDVEALTPIVSILKKHPDPLNGIAEYCRGRMREREIPNA